MTTSINGDYAWKPPLKTNESLSGTSASSGGFEPLKYGSYKDRMEKIKNAGERDVYFPDCKATTFCDQAHHFLKTCIQGTFLQTYDAHLRQVSSNSTDTTFTNRRIAEARAAINLTGKVVLGVSLIGACVGTIAGGIFGMVGGLGVCIATKGEFDPAAGAYLGALAGCAIAGSMCCAGAFVGSALIALTEPNLSGMDRLKTVAAGTGLAFLIALYSAKPIVDTGNLISQIDYLQEGNTKGFLFLHCLGMPT